MTKKQWRMFLSYVAADEQIMKEVTPVDPKELDKFEEKHDIVLPQSYRTYCEVVGAGEIGETFKVYVPTSTLKRKGVLSLEGLNKLARDNEYQIYSKDPDQYARGIFFCDDIMRSHYFFDPQDITDSRRHECAIYVVHRDYSVQRTAENMWEFIAEWCLGDKRRKLFKGRWTPDVVFQPFSW